MMVNFFTKIIRKKAMSIIEKNSTITVSFSYTWQSSEATHRERYLAEKINLWRDMFPCELEQYFMGKQVGEVVKFTFAPGEAVPPFDEKLVHSVPVRSFKPGNIETINPQVGRFYPKGFLQGVAGVYPQSVEPFRVIEVHSDSFLADLNHPLAQYPIDLEARFEHIKNGKVERGGRCAAWLEEITANGPGMQARLQGAATDFSVPDAYTRADETEDIHFYKTPRLVGHIDSIASSFLEQEYVGFLRKGDKVLDLMSSLQSHLPAGLDLDVTGLGMNGEEMQANPALNNFVIHDLNANPILPFDDKEFQVVVCSLSIEYLTKPQEIVNDVARVLEPGGLFMVSFSNRWFPPKVTTLWTHLHEFERLGLVLDYFIENGNFTNLETVSIRNWPRPEDDPHYLEVGASDPVYIVSGVRK